jgi:glycosidase
VLFGGEEASVAAFVVSSFMGGIPLIYNGQEVGCTVKLPFFSRLPINWSSNPSMGRQYKLIMQIRAAHPAIRNGNLQNFSDEDLVVFKRQYADDEVLVLVNTRNTSKSYSVPASLQNTTWVNASTGSSLSLGSSIALEANHYLILSN